MADINIRGIVSAIEQFESEATSNGELQAERAKAMDYYLARPLGTEVTGRSQVVSHDVADSIEWLKPGILRVFTSGDDVVAFTPQGEDDVQGAEQETDYVNYIITQKNGWFNAAYVWFTDALIQKNGYVKAYWDERVSTEKETYKDKTDDEFALILQDPEVEVLEHQAKVVEYPGPMGPQAVSLNDFVIQKKKTYGCAKYLNIPPERTIVSSMHQMVDLEEAPFVEHWEYKTISDLRKEGFEVEDDIASDEEDTTSSAEEQARDRYGETQSKEGETNDPSMRRLRVRECWLRYDEDGDGIAELRHVVLTGQTPLLNEEADFIPIAAITPRIMPHRHSGISEADVTMDIQLIKSTLQRGFLDNVYLSINGRHGVDKSKVNLNDMLTSRPGGIVRTDGPPANAIMPLTHQADYAAVLKGIEYFDMVREGRTGSSKNTQQLSPDVLGKMPSGVAVAQIQNASQAIQELIIRVFAETGVKRLFMLVHALTQKHAKQAEVVRLRNKWVTVDPRQWKTRSDMTISVGLGSGDKNQQLAHLMPLANLQLQLQQTGLTDLKTLHHTLSKLTNAMGFKDSASFWKDPTQIPPKAPQPNPDVIKSQLKVMEKRQELMLKHQLDMAKLQGQLQLEFAKNASQAEQMKLEESFRMQASLLDAELEKQLKLLDADLERQADLMNSRLDHASKQSLQSFKAAA